MEKIFLTDLAFLIPVRIDSIVRIENLLASINYIKKCFNTKIFVLEANKYNNHILERQLPNDVFYFFMSDLDPIFHRTHYINYLSKKCDTPYIAIWDADIVIPENQIIKSISLLRNCSYDVVYPYSGAFYDTTTILRDLFIESGEIRILQSNMSKMLLPYGKNMGGGAIFINKEKFEYAGGEDEFFYGWGPEDWNRLEKWKILEFKIKKIDGPLFHLTHPRDINGGHSSSLQRQYSYLYLRNTQLSSKDDILQHKTYF